MAKKDKSDKKKKSGKLKDATLKPVEARDADVKHSRDVASGEIGMAVIQAARSFRTVQTRHLADCGLYSGQESVILQLANEDGLTPGALAQKLGVKAPTMTRTIGRMEAQGFLERRGSQTDQRLTKVHLTQAGRATLEKISAANAAAEAAATRAMSAKQIRLLLALLEAMDDNLHRDESLIPPA
ncbi:MarR family transcriptional regulator [Allorhizobium sp. BGMRC 0089]|uniref:MarR family winged helix-turn-helix transcriptional regulator n=1 Tax=Allorhizobium sonneratiae TaxID=2934936 RepID=UPI0020341476|nr:MarR family transcriptional regulator [Allorhizobium sonneratiae]MCM2292457.1 MarR family transcriptional regulator [Allorhizobium sonneratiae]